LRYEADKPGVYELVRGTCLARGGAAYLGFEIVVVAGRSAFDHTAQRLRDDGRLVVA
jgi:hypothetical protein